LKVLCPWDGPKKEESDAAFMRGLLNTNTKSAGVKYASSNRDWHFLELLDISDNCIDEAGGVAAAAIICLGPKLLQCNLDWNGIRCRGASALGQALNHVPQSLRALSIDHNPLGDIGAAAIADALVCASQRECELRQQHSHGLAGSTRSFNFCHCVTAGSEMSGAPCLLTVSGGTRLLLI
jgi:hypothetical protein